MGSTERPLQLLDPFLLLGIGTRGCASPPKRSLRSGFHFILPTVIEIGSDLILAARLGHVAALQTFQHNLPLLFWGSLDSRLSRHSRLLAEAPSLTNFRVQFYWGALQHSWTVFWKCGAKYRVCGSRYGCSLTGASNRFRRTLSIAISA